MKLPFGNAQDAHLGTDLLSGYLDNEIAPGERLRVEQHLHSCAACRAELTSLRQTVALLHALPRVPLPRAFTLSEAQVGVRRGAAAGWTWGAARALGAVAALLVVAALAVTLLQRGSQPGVSQVACAPQPAAVPAAPSAAEPTIAGSAATETTAPESQDISPQPPAAAPAPTQPAAQTLAAPGAPPAAPTVRQQAKATSPTSRSQPSATAKSSPTSGIRSTQPPAAAAAQPAEPSATARNSATPASALALAPEVSPVPTEGQRPLMLAAPATSPAAPGATGRGGGGGGGGGAGGAGGAPGAGNPAAGMPLPAIASLEATLPADAGVVYTDHQSLTAVDRGGSRELVQAPGISVPSISGDRAWVSYRVQHDSYAEIWAVRWDGSGAHLVASEREFPRKEGGPAGPVLIERMEWIPGGHTLGLTVAVSAADGSNETRRELWAAKADGGDLRYVLDLGPTGHAVFSPDGKTAALLTRGGPGQPQGTLSLYNADGSGGHTALEFPANVNGYSYESQLQWWADGSGLWAGIPDADALFPENASIGVYRVPVKGAAQLVGKLNALDTFWSHDGKELAYTQPVGGSADNREIVLANADGSRPQNYASVLSGTLADWSPDGKHFTYYSAEEWYEGGPGQKPQELGPAGSMAEVHWVGPGQLLYLQDAGPNWLLVSRSADGKTAGLVPVPKDTDVDMTG